MRFSFHAFVAVSTSAGNALESSPCAVVPTSGPCRARCPTSSPTIPADSAMPAPRDFLFGPWRAVAVLGVTQILAWGTLFYPPVLTVPLIAADHGWSAAFSMGGFSLGLLVAGLVSPRI